MGGSVSSYSPWRRAIAAVAIAGYFGCLAGPPLIGLAADTVGLPAALAIVGASAGIAADMPGCAARWDASRNAITFAVSAVVPARS